MEGTGFTSGEWCVCIRSDELNIEANHDSNGAHDLICDDVETKEDANLIAAAPKMYAEIERDIQNLYQSLCDIDSSSLQYAAVEKKIERKQKLLAEARGEL